MVIVVNEAHQEAPPPTLEDAIVCVYLMPRKSRCDGRAKKYGKPKQEMIGWNGHQISKIGAKVLIDYLSVRRHRRYYSTMEEMSTELTWE